MNLTKTCLLVFGILCFATQTHAQLKYGFKTGLNFASINGPSELNDAGESIENWKNIVGFHIGVSFANKFTDRFGVRGELLYSKRGGQYDYDGQSYRFFDYTGGVSYATGNSKYLININNAYIDLPIVAYYKAGDFEFSGGGYLGLLIQSSGEGSLLFSNGVTENNLPINSTEFFLDYNFRKDKAGEAVEGTETQIVRVDNRNLELPKTIGAYYDAPEGKDKLFNSLDYGLMAGVSYYLSGALYVGVRLQYGLADITNNDSDIAKARTADDKSLLLRDDKDRNFSIQASVGFSF
ncbi:MAG: PorT family protein [Saprospiraceae bacterium]|nr:PorT family protein [Saprospiraceae bacterium]